MAIITISDLRPAGSELFAGSESFLSELNESEVQVQGGFNNQVSFVANNQQSQNNFQVSYNYNEFDND